MTNESVRTLDWLEGAASLLQTTEGQNNLDFAPAAELASGLNIEKGVLSRF